VHLSNGSDSYFIEAEAGPTSDLNSIHFAIGTNVNKDVDCSFSLSASGAFRIVRAQAAIRTRQSEALSLSGLFIVGRLLNQRFGVRIDDRSFDAFIFTCAANRDQRAVNRLGGKLLRQQIFGV
jgi:hypothetical protein